MLFPPSTTTALTQSHAYGSFAHKIAASVESMIVNRSPFFFPEYTDHSIEHIEAVIGTAADLIPVQSASMLTPADWATIIASCCLHDLGMHVSRAGFESLIAKGSIWRGKAEFRDSPWQDLWREFFERARRYNAKELEKIFGKNARPPRPLPLKGAPWDELDILLVGEFLRINHARLAHDIALYGFPAKNGERVFVLPVEDRITDELGDIVGIVARSHGLGLRKCVDYLEGAYGNRANPRGVCATYTMVLLRIADFFQIQASRAKVAVSSIVSFRSSFSANEWRVHQSVLDINNTGLDPDALNIYAMPQDILTFLRLKAWQSSLQAELDISWAVLGEVYGRLPKEGLGGLGISIRRIRSNLDNVDDFSAKAPFIPEEIAFKASSAELLSLLVSPLYGGNIAVGVRELIQNSVDSVKELTSLMANGANASLSRRTPKRGEVCVEILTDEQNMPCIIRIEDAGCGMTISILRDYFLTAGASFRMSDQWRRDHEGADGKSRISRSGPFGVGALAAFLLGEEIRVVTRHFSDDQGLEFIGRVSAEAFSVSKVEAPVGTLIDIRLSREAAETLERRMSWDRTINNYGDPIGHYFQTKPELVRYYGDIEVPVDDELVIPADDAKSSPPWQLAEGREIRLYWKYYQGEKSIFSNGIFVHSKYDNFELHANFFDPPSISVIEYFTNFNLNLQRNDMESQQPAIEPLLSQSITDSFIAHTLLCYQAGGKLRPPSVAPYVGNRNRQDNSTDLWLCGRDGLLLNTKSMHKLFQTNRGIVLYGKEMSVLTEEELARLPQNCCLAEYSYSIFQSRSNDQKGVVSRSIGPSGEIYERLFGGLHAKKINTFISREAVEHMFSLVPGADLRRRLEGLIRLDEYIFHSDPLSGEKDEKILLEIIREQDPASAWMVSDLSLAPDDRPDLSYLGSSPVNFLASRWVEILGTTVLPYDQKERRDMQKRAEKLIREAFDLELWRIKDAKSRGRPYAHVDG